MDETAKDRATMEAIGSIYCRGNHGDVERDGGGMCPRCRKAIEDTLERTARCPYGHAHNCEDCETHCQRGDARRDIKRIMAYAAPRMAIRHPMMTLAYLRKKLRA